MDDGRYRVSVIGLSVVVSMYFMACAAYTLAGKEIPPAVIGSGSAALGALLAMIRPSPG